MKRLTTLLVLVIGFSLCFTSKSFAIDVSFSPPPAGFYEPVKDTGGNVYNKALIVHQRDENSLKMLLCRSDTITQNGVEYEPIIYVGFVDRVGQPDYYAIMNLSITSGSNGKYYSRCAHVASYDFSLGVWGYLQTVNFNPTVRLGTGFGVDMCPYDLSSILAVQDLSGFYYNSFSYTITYSVSKCSAGTPNFTISAYSFRAFARGLWNVGIIDNLPIAGPPELKDFTLEYYTEDFPSPKYIQASSDEPCVVDWTYGIAGYYDLVCPSVDFNLGDASVPSLTITNNTYRIYIPDTSNPCTHIKSINYSLFDTTGQFLCSPISNPISSNYQLPQIPLINLIPPEADWGAFDFLKPAINLILGAFNSLLQAINSILKTVFAWFIPNPDIIRTSVNEIKDLFSQKLPYEAISIGFNNVKNAMLSETIVKPSNSTATLMGTSVTLVNWDLVDANITLIRNVLNAIFYLSLLLVLANLGRKATGQAV